MTEVPPHLPATARETTPENPWPVRLLNVKIGEYVSKMSQLWVEGQIVQLNRRPGARIAFLTLRDTDTDMSINVSIPTGRLDALGPAITQGSRVVTLAKPTFWAKRGTLQLEARQLRPVGTGELLVRLEQLKQTLAAEGLFDQRHKRPLPFLPHRVGLIVGRESAAEKDVVENARRRWPAVQFEMRQVPVQGPQTVAAVSDALRELDAMPEVDVIIVTRGGGAFEDLLPFSNEALVRAVFGATTPVVAAIGHDVDTPLIDFVADVRASTPTDAAKIVVPDLVAEERMLAEFTARLAQGLRGRFAAEQRQLNALVSRPSLRDPSVLVSSRRDEIDRFTNRTGYAMKQRLTRARDRIEHARRQVVALSPQSTLERGYAAVERFDLNAPDDSGQQRALVTSTTQVRPDDVLRITVADGAFTARPDAEPTQNTRRPTNPEDSSHD